MDNDVLQDTNGNIVNPDNNESLENEVEGGVSSGVVSPGTGTPGTEDFEQDEGDDKDINDKDDPLLPGGGDSDSGSDSGSGAGSGTVLTQEQKIPTNMELRVAINRKVTGYGSTSLTSNYDWTSPQTEYYCPTNEEIPKNFRNPLVTYAYRVEVEKKCPTSEECKGIKVNGSPIERPERIPET